MPPEQKIPEPDHAANRRILWWLWGAALAWGLMIGLGAFLQDVQRGMIVFGVVLALAGLWALLLVRQGHKRNSNGKC